MNLDLVLVLVGIAASLCTSAIKQNHWSTKAKQTVSVILSLVGGAVAIQLESTGVDSVGVLGAWAATLGVSQAVFAYVLRGSGLEKVLANLGSPKE